MTVTEIAAKPPKRVRFTLPAGLERMAQILPPDTAAPPILAPATRGLVRQWLVELGAVDALAESGLTPRRTALLYGPPGCGKTTLAHHLGQRLALPLVLVDVASLTSMYVGETGRNIALLFGQLRDHSQDHVLFLDEFDGLAQSRTRADQSAAKEKNNVLVALLQHLDQHQGIVIAATNRAENIDPAIWRRFTLQIAVDLPDDDGRFAILVRYLAPLTLSDDDIATLAQLTAGASPALLRQLMEGVRRDLVLAPRAGLAIDAASVLGRVVAASRPPLEIELPVLWRTTPEAIAEAIAWPPQKRGGA